MRTETAQTIKSIQVICYYSVRFYHFNFSLVLTCLKCEQIYKAGAGVGPGAEKPEIAQPYKPISRVQLVEDRCVASCQQTCCKLMSKLVIHRLAVIKLL